MPTADSNLHHTATVVARLSVTASQYLELGALPPGPGLTRPTGPRAYFIGQRLTGENISDRQCTHKTGHAGAMISVSVTHHQCVDAPHAGMPQEREQHSRCQPTHYLNFVSV